MTTKFKSTLLILLAALSVTLFAVGQVTEAERARKSEEILAKVKEIDLLNQILPLLMTKEQYRKVLPAVEKARQAVRDQQKTEFELLRKMDTDLKLDQVLKDAREKGLVPDRKVIRDSWAVFTTFQLQRKAVADDNTTAVLKIFKETLNDGQLDTARNALSPQLYDPTLDPKKMSDDEKLSFFVRNVILDPAAYDIMLRLSK